MRRMQGGGMPAGHLPQGFAAFRTGRALLALAIVIACASTSVAYAIGLASVELEGNLLDDGSLTVTDLRAFDVSDEHRFVAWDVPTYGSQDFTVVQFTGPGGEYARVGGPATGEVSRSRTYAIVEEPDRIVVYAWFRPQSGRVYFQLEYRVGDASETWGDPARIYRVLSGVPSEDITHSVRLVYNQSTKTQQQEPAPRFGFFIAEESWLAEPADIVERFSVWFGLGIAALALVVLALLVWWEHGWRRRLITGAPVIEPPSGLTPALARRLVRGGPPGRADLMATLLDLVDRNVLSVEPTPGRDAAARVRFDPAASDRLDSHERMLIWLMFGRGKASQTFDIPQGGIGRGGGARRRLAEAVASMLWGVAIARQARDHDLMAPLIGRYLVGRIGTGVLIAAAGVPALVLVRAWWVVAVTSIVGAVVAVAGSVVLRLTDTGMIERRAYLAFRTCLDDVSGCAWDVSDLAAHEWRRAFVLAVEFDRSEAVEALKPSVGPDELADIDRLVDTASAIQG